MDSSSTESHTTLIFIQIRRPSAIGSELGSLGPADQSIMQEDKSQVSENERRKAVYLFKNRPSLVLPSTLVYSVQMRILQLMVVSARV